MTASTTKSPAFSRLELRSVVAIASVAMLRMFGLFMLLPVMALYASSMSSATPILIGAAVGGYGLTQAALQIPFGALSDRIGRRPVIWLGLTLFAAGSAIAGASDDIHMLIAGRLLQGAGAVSATLAALLADVTRPEIRTRSMAVLGVGIGGSFLLSLAFGPVIAASFGTRSLFAVAIGLSAVAALLLLRVPPGERPENAERAPLRASLRPEMLRLHLSVFALHAIMTALFVALPLMLSNAVGLAVGQHWMLYMMAIGLSLAGTVPLILKDERSGKRSTTIAAVGLVGVGLAALALGEPGWLSACLALAVFFAGFNFLEASLPARLSVEAPGASRGSAMGVFSSSQFLGAFAGGLGGGAAYAAGGVSAVFVLAAAVAGTWLVLLAIPGKGRKEAGLS